MLNVEPREDLANAHSGTEQDLQKTESAQKLSPPDFISLPNDNEVKIIEEWSRLSDLELVRRLRAPLRAIMFELRKGSAERMSADKWVYHMLPAPGYPGRENPLVVLPGKVCGYAESCGGCTMCNFAGEGREPNNQDIDQAMDFILRHNEDFLEKNPPKEGFPGLVVININAVGSFFNNTELPPDLRERIYERIKEYKIEAKRLKKDRFVVFVIETRFDELPEEELDNMLKKLEIEDDPLWPGQKQPIEGPKSRKSFVELGLGVESTDLLVREGIINKGLPDDWKEKIQKVKSRKNVEIALHFMYGTPLLDKDQANEDTINSLLECLPLSEKLLWMVTNIKPGTLNEYLHRYGQYDLPTIYDIGEGIVTFGEKLGPERIGELSKLLIFGLVSPREHVEAGTINVRPQDEKGQKIYDILTGWRGTKDEYDRLKATVRSGNEEKKLPDEKMQTPKEERRRIKEKLIFTYGRIIQALFGDKGITDLSEALSTFRQLDPELWI